MKKRLSIQALFINLILAFSVGMLFSQSVNINPLVPATTLFVGNLAVSYFTPNLSNGIFFMALQKEVWITDLKEQPLPDTSFVMASTDMSEYVENNIIHLQEAGIEPQVFEDYFATNIDDLPFADTTDIPHEVLLKTYSTEQTKHRNLEDIELSYDRRGSVIKRHRTALNNKIGAVAAYAWTTAQTDAFNKLINLGATDSVLDALIDLRAFYQTHDMAGNLNICLSPEHEARIAIEDKKLYKEFIGTKGAVLYGFKIFSYSKTPLFDAGGVKKPINSVAGATDKRSSFAWCTDEVFRCFGDVEVYETLRHSGQQADMISFAQRALVGNIRATTPKYLGTII